MTVLSPAVLPQVVLAGQPIPDQVLLAVEVFRSLDAPAHCCCQLLLPHSKDFLAQAAPGQTLSVSVAGSRLFTGTLTGFSAQYHGSHPVEVALEADDALIALRQRATVAVQARATLAAVWRDHLSPLGLRLRTSNEGPRLPLRLTGDADDLAWLLDQGRRCGLQVHLYDDTLVMLGPEDDTGLAPGGNLVSWRVERHADGPRSIHCPGLDAAAVTVRDGRAEVGGTAGGGELRLVGQGVQSLEEARLLAQAEALRRTQAAWRVSGQMMGLPSLLPGMQLDLPAPAGRRRISQVRHCLSPAQGFLTTFDTHLPAVTAPLSPSGPLLGRVQAIDDPDHRGRVRVALADHGGLAGDWMPVLLPTGPGKGLLVLPDVGDTVLVLPTSGPGQGVVLGAVPDAPQPDGDPVAHGRSTRYGLRSPKGAVLQLDDTADTVVLSHPAGHRLELTPGGATLRAAGRLVLEAPGGPVTIRGAAIDFESG